MNQPADFLPVGDLRRHGLRDAVLGAAAIGAIFTAFAFVVKEVHTIGDYVPWADDPFDVVTSFAIFFAPVVVGLSLLRLPLCRRSEPLPMSRARDLLNGAILIVGIAMVTVISDWLSVVLVGAGSWDASRSFVLAALAGVTLLTALSGRRVVRSRRSVAGDPIGRDSDLLGDLVALARYHTSPGPWRAPILAGVALVERWPIAFIRRHPVVAAAALAGAFGLGLGVVEASAEGGLASAVAALFVVVGASGMFAFLVLAGAFLGWVRPMESMPPSRRRLVDAIVAAAASVPLSLGFRSQLSWLVDTSSGSGVDHIAMLLAIVAAAVFLAVLAIESLRLVEGRPLG